MGRYFPFRGVYFFARKSLVSRATVAQVTRFQQRSRTAPLFRAIGVARFFRVREVTASDVAGRENRVLRLNETTLPAERRGVGAAPSSKRGRDDELADLGASRDRRNPRDSRQTRRRRWETSTIPESVVEFDPLPVRRFVLLFFLSPPSRKRPRRRRDGAAAARDFPRDVGAPAADFSAHAAATSLRMRGCRSSVGELARWWRDRRRNCERRRGARPCRKVTVIA